MLSRDSKQTLNTQTDQHFIYVDFGEQTADVRKCITGVSERKRAKVVRV